MSGLHRILLANRGEIVVRIARTARRLGIGTVAVYSDADRNAPHVAACDDAVPIGGQAATESYLCADKILAAARLAHVDAVHPGYGFLSENAAFAEAVTAAGLTFIGPPAAAIAAMGDKAQARRRMAAAGIPVLPGYDGAAQDEATLRDAATAIGFPIMVKAAAGGGGRGMRLVHSAGELPAALRSAASEAAKAFGDGRLILERAVVEPRHVEIQVFADVHGHVIHLGERDCSVQRRHQKVIEEAPSPVVDAGLRARMGETAVAAAREIGYVGAGTVEFLLERDGRFHFMEMNTRLQVEHPVTELVTGLDLVELQLRVARGEPLPITQEQVALRGHAIEVRLCAESPADGFLPGSGRVIDWYVPGSVRCDHAIAVGTGVTAWYDSLVAKVIAHASTRAGCIERLAAALDHTSLLGVTCNRAFLARALRHPAFVDGRDVTTSFIARHFEDPASRGTRPDDRTWALAAWLSLAAAPETAATDPAWRHWTTGRPLPYPWRLCSHDHGETVERHGRVTLTGDLAQVEIAEAATPIDGRPAKAGSQGRVQVGDAVIDYRYAWHGSTLWLHTPAGDHAFECRRREPARSAQAEATLAAELRASINARVIDVPVRVGDDVVAGQPLIVLEAMKMEHEMRAARTGRIAEVAVRLGDQVAPGQVLVRYAGAGA